MAGGHRASFAECLRDQARVAVRILGPLRGAGRRIDAHDSVGPRAQFAQLTRDPAGFAHLRDELLPLLRAAHGRAAAGGRPHRRYHGPHHQVQRAHLLGEPREVVIARINANVRVEQEEVHAIELGSVGIVQFGRGSQPQHGVQADGRFGIRPFAYQTGPHGVVDAGEIVVRIRGAHDAPY